MHTLGTNSASSASRLDPLVLAGTADAYENDRLPAFIGSAALAAEPEFLGGPYDPALDSLSFPGTVEEEGGIEEFAPPAPPEPEPKKNAAAKKPAAKKAASKSVGFIMPTAGLNWGKLHGHNGVDIANDCNDPVVASAAGTVADIGTGWSGGYGNNVVIKHPSGKSTLYAHLSRISVKVGQSVSQGHKIGTVGSTGRSTGCHVHFEVRGGGNPFAR